MKKIIFFTALLVAITIKASAQIPNNGFENWTTIGNYENPNGWATMNPYNSGPFYSTTKSTDHYPPSIGNYSIRIENNTSLTQFTGGYGMAVTNAFDYPFKPAFQVIGHPTSLTGYYKYQPFNSDTMFIKVILFSNGVIVANDDFESGVSQTNWTSFSIPISNYITVDSATIMISAFTPTSSTNGPNGNSVIYVDNLNFDNLISSVNETVEDNYLFSFFPNPATDFVTINTDIVDNERMELNFYNVIGELIRTEELSKKEQNINICDLTNGIYLLEIKLLNRSSKQKLIINR